MKTAEARLAAVVALACCALARAAAGAPPVKLPDAGELEALRAAIAGADRIRAVGNDGTAEPGAFDSSDPREIAAFAAALQIVPPEVPVRDLCAGSPAVTLFRDGRVIASLSYHHGQYVRSERWKTDLPLVDAEPLVRWFEARGIRGPRREEDQAAELERSAERWFEAMPRSLQPFWPAMQDAEWPDYVSEEADSLRAPLAAEYPAPRDRVRALFGWFGSGAGLWSGYPYYEILAEHLLMEYPMADLLAVAEEPDLALPAVEGVARLFAGWNFSQRRPGDLALLSPTLKARLLAHSLASTNEDKRGRAQVAFGE